MSSDAEAPCAIRLHDIGKTFPVQAQQGSLFTLASRGLRHLLARSTGNAPAKPEGFSALQGVSVEIRRGECVGVLGRNGSGKSTLLQILAGTMHPTTGEGEIHGRTIALLELGSGFNPHFTGRENVFLYGSLFGFSRERMEERIGDIIRFADIGHFIDQPVRVYSSGMFVRLAFAVASHLDPEVLIVDEALSVGDMLFQNKCYDLLKNHMPGVTKFFASHDIHGLNFLSDRVLVIDHGRLVYDGEPLQATALYTKLLHAEQEGGCPMQVDADDTPPPPEKGDWKAIDPDSLSGLGHVVISHFAVQHQAGGTEKEEEGLLACGDKIHVSMRINVTRPHEHLVFGYLVRDRVGNAIFGENSISLPNGNYALGEGRFQVGLSFSWPEIVPGDYFLTLGVGEGTHAHDHKIQCWATNIHNFKVVDREQKGSCLFACPIAGLRILDDSTGEVLESEP